jgi:hypothetical protein
MGIPDRAHNIMLKNPKIIHQFKDLQAVRRSMPEAGRDLSTKQGVDDAIIAGAMTKASHRQSDQRS